MHPVRSLSRFVRPYRSTAVATLSLLTILVALDLAIPRMIQHLIDHGVSRGDMPTVITTALGMLALSGLSAVIAVFNNSLSVRVGESVARDLRAALFDRIQGFSFGNLDREKTGALMVRLTSDVATLKGLTQISLRIGTRAPLLMTGSLCLLVVTSPSLALHMAPLLIVTGLLIAFFVARMEPIFRAVQARLDRLNTTLQENLAGVRLVRSLVRRDFEEGRFQRDNRDMTEQSIRALEFAGAMTPALTLAINVGIVIVLWSGGLSAIRGALSVGQIVAFTNYLLTTLSPLVMMTLFSNTWAMGVVSARRVEDLLATEPEVRDAPDAQSITREQRPEIAFEAVSFSYPGEHNEPALCEVSFQARPGETVAILGATGAGKSTLIALIPRFYDPQAGVVRFGGMDVRRVTQASLLARIAYVPQEAVLFSGTVRDNIRYGRPDATQAQVERAARAAQAHEFIAALPGGYDTRVEARGVNFSGGQKQRLALARALVLDADVLILDDVTSAVDADTEGRIQQQLAASRGERTTFLVAQRIASVLWADRILLLDKGRLVASGTHAELLRANDLYREIYDSQLGGGTP
ncbi:MAG TPA: ABC transporter ATP-binding protein [Polyangiaceae bacterium]|nr:ABC transporter ATP-binding protein [Polyangiaceae bacterium]